jgi:hypothetical protein
MMYKITMRAGGVDPNIGPTAAEDIQTEFRDNRPWHEKVTCTYADGTLWLVAVNDYDADGAALSDEFSDCISAFIPLGRIRDEGVFEVVAVEAP